VRQISVEKDWKHVLMQKVVTLNTLLACCQTSQPVLFRATDENPQLLLFSTPVFERTQQTFSQMKKFCSSQVSVVTFPGGMGKWITVCFLLRKRK